MEKIKVLTHDNKFHADEVFAIAILQKIYPKMEIIRSREIDKYPEVNFKIDLGGDYNFEKKIFDHHQAEFDLKRENGIPYSSCGLIWKDYWNEIVDSEEEFKYIDENLFQFIDADDNGITTTNQKVQVYSVADVIMSYNPLWNSEKGEEECFLEALNVAKLILDNIIEKAKSISRGNEIVFKAIEEANNLGQDFVIFTRPNLPTRSLRDYKRIKFFVAPQNNGRWVSVAVQVKGKTFAHRGYFPKSWGGLYGKELEEVSGVKGANFCHKHLFIVGANSKEAAIEMTKKALLEKD